MRNSGLLALGMILAVSTGVLRAQGIGIKRGNGPVAMNWQLRITVPVEIKNYPLKLAGSGSAAAQVQCKVMAPAYLAGGIPVLVPVGQSVTVAVPFNPSQGLDSYQGSVTVVLTVPGGTAALQGVKPGWQCSITTPALGQGARLDQAASVQFVRGDITP